MCHTLSFWREALPAPMAAVFVLRDPLQVPRCPEDSRRPAHIPGLVALGWHGTAVGRSEFGGSADTRSAVRPDAVRTARGNVDDRGNSWTSSESGSPRTARAAAAWFDPGLQHQRSELDEYSEMASVQRQIFSQLSSCVGIHPSWDPPAPFPEPPLWVDDCIELRRKHGILRVQLGAQASRAYRVATALDKAKGRLGLAGRWFRPGTFGRRWSGSTRRGTCSGPAARQRTRPFGARRGSGCTLGIVTSE